MDYRKYLKEKKEHPIYGGSADTSGQPAAHGAEAISAGEKLKKFLGVKFECCGTYARAYRNPSGTAYLARCPRCGQTVTIGIDAQHGTDARFFVVK
jgi:hypothetical protein